MFEGYYYLHVNGELIYKGAAYTDISDFRESDLVRCFWTVDTDDREVGKHAFKTMPLAEQMQRAVRVL